MKNYSFIANAKSRTISLNYIVSLCETSPQACTKFESQERFRILCETGCKNYNRKWSCPPSSPKFSSYALKWSYLYILYMRAPLSAFLNIKNEYLRIKAANSMLKSRAEKYMRGLSEIYGKYISTGSCRLCKPCKYQLGVSCAHPNLMAYSFESLGINVGALVNEYFDRPLLWYKKGCLPEYTSVVCGLLSNESISFDLLKEHFFKLIKE